MSYSYLAQREKPANQCPSWDDVGPQDFIGRMNDTADKSDQLWYLMMALGSGEILQEERTGKERCWREGCGRKGCGRKGCGREGHRWKGRRRDEGGRDVGGRDMGGKEKDKGEVERLCLIIVTPSFGTIPGIACASQTSPANQEIHHTNICE